MKIFLKIVLIIVLFLYLMKPNIREFFYKSGRKIYDNHSGGKGCKYVSKNVNRNGFACCTKFNDEKKYKNKCCVKVDKNNNCISWQGLY